jgi:hypothetical protein
MPRGASFHQRTDAAAARHFPAEQLDIWQSVINNTGHHGMTQKVVCAPPAVDPPHMTQTSPTIAPTVHMPYQTADNTGKVGQRCSSCVREFRGKGIAKHAT